MSATVPTPNPLRNILVPTDFSPCSETVLPYAASIARARGATLFMAHVVTPEVLSVEPPVIMEVRDTAEKQLQDLLISEQLEGISCKALVGEGETSDSISKMIKDNSIDLIVLGTHGRTGFRKLVIGSVAEDIFRHAACPVLIVGPRVNADNRRDASFNRIIFGTDLGPGCAAGFSYVRSIIEPAKCNLTLLHVLPTAPRGDSEQSVSVLRGNLAQLIPTDLTFATPPEALVEIGDAAECIVHAAAGRRADLIILGCRRPAALTSHFMDTAYRVVIEAPCPVLTLSAAYKAAAI